MKTDVMTLAHRYALAYSSTVDHDATKRHVEFSDECKAELQSAIEALQADAERYRWVRDPESDSPLMFSPGSYNAKYGLVDLEDMLVGASLDAAIDAAMALDKP